MSSAYAGLTPAQLAVARALAASPRWSWGVRLVALRPDGALVELVPGRAYSRERCVQDGMVPMLTDPGVLGHLLDLLGMACVGAVGWTLGRRTEAEGGAIYWCRLEAGQRVRSWEGASLGEVVGAALVARWSALDRSRTHIAETDRDPRGWAQAVMARVRQQ